MRLPAGFAITPYATEVEGARSLALSESGTLYVGTRKTGKVYAITNADHDGVGDRVFVLAEGLNSPNGVAFHHGALYVAEISRVLRFDGIEQRLAQPPKPVVVIDSLPSEEAHGWKFIAVGPDRKLYVPIGAPCNVCESRDPRYASISRMNLDGSGFEVVARGVRNSVGFDWQPTTHTLWFTDNGRDRLGDDVPSDELNSVQQSGEHFGFPFCHAGDIRDPDYGTTEGCSRSTPPRQKLGAHVAALGMRFYTGQSFPIEYRQQIFIAEHGSWNRSRKSGYRISVVHLEGNEAKRYETFASGWLDAAKDEAWGRPVDLVTAPDGSLLVSDDQANAIYRISH